MGSSTVDALIWYFMFFDVFTDCCGPLDLVGLELFILGHNKSIVLLAEACGLGDEFGVLPVD